LALSTLVSGLFFIDSELGDFGADRLEGVVMRFVLFRLLVYLLVVALDGFLVPLEAGGRPPPV
jgi:hypothetical protein